MNQEKTCGLPADLKNSIIALARKHNFSKLMLFGSRARGDNREASDIDLAVFGKKSSDELAQFRDELLNTRLLPTLLLFDVVDMDSDMVNPALYQEILKEGVVLWENNDSH